VDDVSSSDCSSKLERTWVLSWAEVLCRQLMKAMRKATTTAETQPESWPRFQFGISGTWWTNLKANSHMPCSAHAIPLPCHATLTLSVYSVASRASCPDGVLYSAIFITLLKKKYWRYWLQACTIRLPHACSFSDTVQISSRCVCVYVCLTVARERLHNTVLTCGSMDSFVLSQLTHACKCSKSLCPSQ
jgi:hypothetical protein